MMLMLLEKTTISYSSSYQASSNNNIDDNIANTINNIANLTNKNNVKDIQNHQMHFLLCEHCLWCATYLIDKDRAVSNCPICNNAKVESLPIATNEVYKLSGSAFEFGTGNMKRS